MPTNIEIKARVRDVAALRARAQELSDASVQVIPQEDTFFATQKGRLKLRELGPALGQLVYYERADQGGPKRSDYRIFETHDVAGLREILSLALGVRGVVKKVRSLYLVGQTRLHLDDVDGLGQFMELEVVLQPGQSEAEGMNVAMGLMAELGVEETDLLEGAYMDLLEQQR
jgi:predicted adenylyl cyclase CyaB